MFGTDGRKCADAQAALLGPGAAFIGAGVSHTRTTELDERLAAHGYPTFGRNPFTINLGAYRILSSRVLLGFEGNGLVFGEKSDEGGDVGTGGGYATLGVGYMLQLSPRIRAYPRLGIGAGGMGMWIENDADSIPFDDVLANPRRGSNKETILSRDGFVADVGAGVEFLRARRSGAMLGLRVGYLIAPFSSAWDLVDTGKASSGPDATIAGPYIKVLIGGAWTR
jgi:hypothetical protein